MTPLDEKQLRDVLNTLPGWSVQNHMLCRTVTNATLRASVDLTARVATISDAQDHHPDILIQSGKVTVKMTTHDAGDRISERDVALARALQPLLDAVVAP
jgi:4a-hydroxytetrahydrobiopterin dehydratase